jgi:hypothetical protein
VRTDAEILDQTNSLAREFYALSGNVVPDGYRFDLATHPLEVAEWQRACAAQLMLTDTDIDDVIAELDS